MHWAKKLEDFGPGWGENLHLVGFRSRKPKNEEQEAQHSASPVGKVGQRQGPMLVAIEGSIGKRSKEG